MKIRKANKSDLGGVVEVLFRSDHPFNKKFKETKKSIKKWFKPSFFQNDIETYVCVEKNIIGFIILKKFFSASRSCEILDLAVDKSFHGKGVGTKLMDFIENRAKKLKFERIFLYTSLKKNKRARKFYEKLNYKKVNIFHGFYRFGGSAVLYVKKLM